VSLTRQVMSMHGFSETSPEPNGTLHFCNSIDEGTEKWLTSVNIIEDVNDS
jgi:hypothetical protein